MDAIRPDYGGAWVGALVPALLGSQETSWLPEPVAGASGVVVLVLDGLGWEAVCDHPDLLPTLSAMEGQAITTVVPSTTAAGLTSITTGLPPAAHGVLGYRMRVGGQVLNVLRWQTPGSEQTPEPATVQPIPPFKGQRVPVVTRAEFRGTGFTVAHLRGAQLVGWRTTSTLLEHCRRLAVGRHPFVYVYYDGIDKVAHEFGLHNGFFQAELAAADRLVADLLAVLPDSYALIVTADHGQVHSGQEAIVGLEPLHPLVAMWAGEGRFRSLHARAGAAADLLATAADRFGDVAWVLCRDELFDDGWLGDGASAVTRGRVGDVVLAARGTTAFFDPTDPKDRKMISRHGSLTSAEMRVPLLAARGGA